MTRISTVRLAGPVGVRVPGLDGLRGVAVLLVVAFHVSGRLLPFGGFVGVTTFFTLSGFLITRILIRERESTGRIDLKAFYIRRLLRLYPALILLLLVLPVLLFAAGDAQLHDYLWRAAASGFYFSNLLQAGGHGLGVLTHTWSLSVEEQFYLVWPILLIGLASVARGSRKHLVWSIAVCLAGALSWRVFAQVTFGFERVYYAPDTNAFALLAGGLLGSIRTLRRMPAWFGWLSIASLVALAALRPPPGVDPDLMSGLVITLTPAVAVAVVWAAAHGQKLLEFGPLKSAGVVSYGLYLWHDPLLKIHWGGVENEGLMRVAAIAAAVGVAWASYRWLEQPLLTVRKQFERSTLNDGVKG